MGPQRPQAPRRPCCPRQHASRYPRPRHRLGRRLLPGTHEIQGLSLPRPARREEPGVRAHPVHRGQQQADVVGFRQPPVSRAAVCRRRVQDHSSAVAAELRVQVPAWEGTAEAAGIRDAEYSRAGSDDHVEEAGAVGGEVGGGVKRREKKGGERK